MSATHENASSAADASKSLPHAPEQDKLKLNRGHSESADPKKNEAEPFEAVLTEQFRQFDGLSEEEFWRKVSTLKFGSKDAPPGSLEYMFPNASVCRKVIEAEMLAENGNPDDDEDEEE